MAAPLPPLPEVQRLSPAVIRILGGNPGKFALQGTNTYLLGTGPSRLLVDTGDGTPSWIAALRRVLAGEHAELAAALLTHRHADHVGGVPHLLEAWPALAVHKYRSPDEDEDDDKRRRQQQQPWRHMADGQRFAVAGATLTAVHTPGHTPDHVVLVLAEEDALLTGDNVLGHGTAVFEDLAAYMASLARMRDLFAGRAYPGHGDVVRDGPGRIREYIEHRRLRQEQVLRTLGSGKAEEGWTPMELVKVIYSDVPENLHEAAAGGVLQILRKLEKEGRKVTAGAGRWKLASDRLAL